MEIEDTVYDDEDYGEFSQGFVSKEIDQCEFFFIQVGFFDQISRIFLLSQYDVFYG